MTIENVAKMLNSCANGECFDCKYFGSGGMHICQAHLIQDMAKECRKIVAEEDDLK